VGGLSAKRTFGLGGQQLSGYAGTVYRDLLHAWIKRTQIANLLDSEIVL